MAKFIKLPDELKSWKINSVLGEGKDGGVYKASKKDYDGTTINAILRNISLKAENYNSENIDFINNEAEFLQSVSRCGNNLNYIDIFVSNRPTKEKIDLYIITEELPALSQILETKTFSEDKVIDFGIQMSSVLESLESKNIFHGNLTPDNIYVANDGTYKVGGFSDFESKISDFSFVAPEIYKKEDADFTTDIYSLGLIMYYMSNGNKLPFESETNDKKAAIEKRMSGEDVSTPANGSDKLKSVIMIACKSDNKYRWKNAGNIKNALLSMKGEAMPVQAVVSAIPENTEFNGNVFEEYEYDEFEEPKQEEVQAEEQIEKQDTISPVADEIAENADSEQSTQEDVDEISDVQSETTSESDDNFDVVEADYNAVSNDNVADNIIKKDTEKPEEKATDSAESIVDPIVADETIDDDQIFDKLESKGKNKLDSGFENKDYGSFFDDDDIKPDTKKADADIDNFDVDETGNKKDFDNYYDDFDTKDENADNNEKKSKKNIIIIAACIVIILALLGGVCFFAFSSLNGSNRTNSTQPSSQSTTETTEPVTTTASATQPTTVAPTTVAQEVEVVPVTGLGYGYSYAKKLLEEAGFVVEIGEYRYSEDCPEGYVISQSPEGNTKAKYGSVVTLDVSSGLIEPETEEIPTEAPTEAPSEAPTEAQVSAQKTNNSFIFPNSSTAYISKSDVEQLSSDELTIAINEIYARNGRIFTNTSLANYFNSQSWYTPKYTAEEFDKNVKFNQYEQANLQLLISYR